MEIELHPTVSLLPDTNSHLIAPVELLTGAQSSHLELRHYKILFISGAASTSWTATSRSWRSAAPTSSSSS
jgi:hypothetical protein